MTAPTHTRAVVNDAAEPLATRIVDIETPLATPNEALIAVEAFSVNRGELALLRVRPDGWRPGQDVAGTVLIPAADGSGPPAGTRVCALVEGGGWARHVAAPTDRLAAVPDSVAAPAAATLGVAGLTALRMLRLGGPLLGAHVLVTAASGAVGRFAVQLARLQGARVRVVARAEHAGALRDLGAAEVVPSPAAVGDGRFDLVLESVGGSTLAEAISVTRPGATVVVYGTSSGEPTPLTIYDFLGHEDVVLRTYFSYHQNASVADDLALLLSLLDDGSLAAPLDSISNWGRLASALDRLQRRQTAGKIALTV